MRTSTLEQLKRHLRPGRVYRRQDLLSWSQSVDRHLKELTVDGTLQKLRNLMKPSTEDEVEGKFHDLKGQVKKRAGQLTNDADLVTEGKAEEVSGKVQEKIGQVK